MEVFIMLLLHISLSLGLIALVSGVSLYLWSVRAEAGAGIGLAKVIGIIVIILAILELLVTAYSGIAYGRFQHKMHQSPVVSNPTNAADQELPQPAPLG